MDNTAQNQDNQTTQPAQQTQINQVNQQAPVASGLNKEKGISAFSENIKPSEEEPKIENEVQVAGVSAINDKPKLDEVHEQIGVTYSAESTPVKIEPTGKVELPMSEKEASETLKMKQSKFNIHENVGEFAGEYTEDSRPFLAALIVKVFKEMHKKVFRRGR